MGAILRRYHKKKKPVNEELVFDVEEAEEEIITEENELHDEETEETEHQDDEVSEVNETNLDTEEADPAEFPKHTGGGWYELSNGEKVQGKEKAEKAEKEKE